MLLQDCMKLSLLTAAVLAFAGPAAAAPDGVFVYPQKGQSDEQKSSDDRACEDWSKKETRFDPAAGPAAVASSSGGGQAVRGAARGAALGALIGAAAGDAGKGAAIGAGVGGVGGLGRRRGAQDAANQAQARANADYERGLDQYKRAYSACMSGRGYSVN